MRQRDIYGIVQYKVQYIPLRNHSPTRRCRPHPPPPPVLQVYCPAALSRWRSPCLALRCMQPQLSVKGYLYTVCIYTYRYPFVAAPLLPARYTHTARLTGEPAPPPVRYAVMYTWTPHTYTGASSTLTSCLSLRIRRRLHPLLLVLGGGEG